MAWSKLLLLALLQCIGSLAEQSESRTILAIPFLFPWKDGCSQRYPPGDTHQYRFFFTSQIQYVPTFTEIYTVHRPPREDPICERHPQNLYKFTFNSPVYEEHFMSHEGLCNVRSSMCYQCQNEVMSLVGYFSDNPSLSMIAHLFGSHFNHSLAIYPVPFRSAEKENKLYTYRVLFGAPRYGKLDGIVIEVIYRGTNVTIHNGRGAIALRNGRELHEIQNSTFELTDQCETSILWIEPKPVTVSNCTATVSLQQVVIESSQPLKVFTQQAQCNSNPGEFSYISQLVHEMPPPNKWGQHFILDIQQARILPAEIKNILKYDISFLASQQNTSIKVIYYKKGGDVDIEQYTANNDSLRIQKTATQVEGLTHIDISATGPILSLYTVHGQGPEALYLSTVIQPVNWFANIQTLALSRANGSTQLDCNYHVSVVVPIDSSNSHDIFISNADKFNNNTSLSSQKRLKSFKSGDFELFSYSPILISDVDTFLVWHRDPTVAIGVTVFAYCPQKHFAYSNGYIADNSSRDLFPSPDPSPVDNRATLGALALLLMLIVPVLGVICYWRCRTRKTFRVKSDEYVRISKEPGTDYEYDVFILFPEEDEDFVREFIYEPVRRRNYRVLWRGEGSHDLFKAGSDAVENLASAIQISRKIIVVCTRNFTESGAFDRDVSFFKDVQKSERKRRLIPLVIEGEYMSEQFKDYNQIRVGCRTDLNNSRAAEEMLQRLVNSIGDPIHSSEESLVFSYKDI